MKKILVVEDNQFLLDFIEFTLKNGGYSVKKAVNGKQALDILAAEDIDLVITDIKMPKLSGLDFLRALKRTYMRKLPIIIISSLKKLQLSGFASRLKVNSVIEKPINYPELLSKVNHLLQKDTSVRI